MKGSQKCHHHKSEDDDSVSYMSEVNKGAQKIIIDIPDQLTSVFIWIVSTGFFIVILVMVTYLVLKYESPTNLVASAKDAVIMLPRPSSFRSPETAPTIVNVTTREYCSTVSKDLYSLEQIGYVDTSRWMSKLMALKIDTDDVHYVFINSTHVPWLYMCSLESTLRAVANNSRVNVFVIYGIESKSSLSDKQSLVLLSMSLSVLMSAYGGDRLNVVHVNLEECLECSPFQGMDLSGSPTLANYVVQLVLLWQFGGTAMDARLVAVRNEVYRANGTAVEFGVRMTSSPVACHAFIYDAMLCAKSYALQFGLSGPNFVHKIIAKTVERNGRAGRANNVRHMADGIVCRNGVINGHCYYVETDRAAAFINSNSYVRGFCPVVSRPPSSDHKTVDDVSDD